MKLPAGERYAISNEENFIFVVSGSVEVYAVTRGDKEFHQVMLMSLESGEAAFPSVYDLFTIDISLYALEDTEIQEKSFKEVSSEELLHFMEEWFFRLSEVPWMRMLADRGDDIIRTWKERGVFCDASGGTGKLMEIFHENESIFAMLQWARFSSDDKQFQRRMDVWRRQKKRLIDASVWALLQEDMPIYEESVDERKTARMGESILAVRAVLKAFSMPDSDISIPIDIAKKLDQVEILRRLAQKGNIQLRLVRLEGDWYNRDNGVLIGYLQREEKGSVPVALVPEGPDSYKIVTKAHPEGIPITKEIAGQLDKDAFQCYGGFPLRKLTIPYILRFMFNQCWKKDFRTILLVSLFVGFIPLAAPIITETIFQDILPVLDIKGLVMVTQVLMVTSFTMAVLSVLRSVAVVRISTRLDMSVEAALWGRLLSLPEKFFRRFTSGELVNRMRGVEAVREAIGAKLVSSVLNAVFSFWSLILMCWYSLKLTAVAVAVWLVWCLAGALIYRRVIEFQRKLVEADNKQAGLVQQIFAGLAKFRVNGAEEQAYHLWSRAFGESWRWNLAMQRQKNYAAVISTVQPFVLTLLIYYVTVYGLQDSSVFAGFGSSNVAAGMGYAQFLAFQAAYASFNVTIGSVIPMIGQFFTLQPHIENLRPILEEVPETTGDKMDAESFSGALEVSHLTFSYGEGKPDVLKDLSFHVSAGENLAIVGSSGCGKSTLVRLLLGFEQPKTGAIYYDGQSLAELSLPSVRSQMGVVLQNGQLMTGDILTNIIGPTALSQEDAWEAAEAAGIAEDIRLMPMGMHTVISEGSSNISGGQRQRILIARALASRPAILIFDEATSALDNRTQAIVMESIEKLEVTRIVIAHRLSTIRNCDRILVMDSGHIAESGTYDELVAKDGLFARLVKRQVA